LKRFDFLIPHSLDEAVTMLSECPEAAPLAGGTNLLVQIKEKHREESAILSINHIPELHIFKHNAGLHIGAAVTLNEVASDPIVRRDYKALATAAGLVGSVQTRNMATIGGNICNASPSADTAPPLLVLGAEAVLIGPEGRRTLPLHDFFLGPGQTVIQPGELLVEIFVPPAVVHSSSCYVRHIPRQAMDISVVGVAVALALDADENISEGRIALGAVAPTPMLARKARAHLLGQRPSEDLWDAASRAAAEEAQPVDDIRASVDFRRHLVGELTKDALRIVNLEL
jgi:CO/xanthine dehydrogenase FAD-binding subunit